MHENVIIHFSNDHLFSMHYYILWTNRKLDIESKFQFNLGGKDLVKTFRLEKISFLVNCKLLVISALIVYQEAAGV